MAFKIGLLGFGTVGSGTVQILQNPTLRHPLLHDITLHRVGVRSLDKPRPIELAPDLLTTDLEAIVTDPEVDVVVELIGGLEPARSLILKAIAHKKHVVTANKAVIARYSDEIFDAANAAGVYVMIEAAVAGGIPVIQPLRQALSVNRLHRVTGIINGTTNYILTRMQREGADFTDVLADAQALGYAEADPTADVDGLDAADKIAILAALAFGGRVNLTEVYCEGIRNVTASDIAYAEDLGFVIKLLATAQRDIPDDAAPGTTDRLQVRVHPTLLPKDHPLASVNDVFNAVLIEGDPIGQVMFFGPGAGMGPTASAVVSDIQTIAAALKSAAAAPTSLNPLMACIHEHYCTITPMEDLVTRFYARLLSKDQPGVIGKIGTCFGNHDVSLESIVQIDSHQDLAEIVVVTHNVREGNFRQALDEMRHFEAVSEIPSTLRVL
ncbi:homoserine dehydrogenase [Vacuolonema iberomarrocanum]|uniref:homoserine dehydrogenase n=1 Tax=Vacuolonema iberomarrocanum TaxID=3454632 RepID=UPI001A0DF336|nr:homoserine dehydrogenase [filamentous cyanobacterium LEGE 07170]